MNSNDQPANDDALPPEDWRFPFPSLAFTGRRTIAPGELAARLAVSEAHVQTLVKNGLLETRPRFIIGGERWIAVEPLKKFLRGRLCGPMINVPFFLSSAPYGAMLKCHQDMAATIGDTWQYPVINQRMYQWPAFIPKSMAIPGQTALSLSFASLMLRCDEELLSQRIESYRLPGVIDLRLGEGLAPVHRVPVEAYRFWLNMLFSQGRTDCLLLARPGNAVREIYMELGAFLGGKLVTQS